MSVEDRQDVKGPLGLPVSPNRREDQLSFSGVLQAWNKQSGAAPHVNEYLFSGTNQGLSIVLLKLLVAQARHSNRANDRDSASQFKELEAQIADFVLVFQTKITVFEGQENLII